MSTTNFCKNCGKPIDVNAKFCSACGSNISENEGATPIAISPKSGIATLLLCLFFGAFGIHRFYVGKIGTGILMLLTGGGLGIWTLVDIILIASCEFKDKENRYVMFKKGKSSPVKLILTIIGLFISVLIVYLVLLITLVMFLTSGITDTARNELSALKHNDIEKAYTLTSDEFKAATSLENFKKFVADNPILVNHTDASLPERKIENNRGIIHGSLTSKSGTSENITFILVKENKEWKIFSIHIEPPKLTSTAISSSNQDKLEFSDNSLGFSTSYANNWEYTKPNNSSVLFSGKSGTPSYYSTVSIQAIPLATSGGIYKNVDEIIADLKKQIISGTTDTSFIKEGESKLNYHGKYLTGKFFITTYTYKKTAIKKLQFVVINPDTKIAYAWGYTAPARRFNEDLPTAQKMFESWTLNLD